jgi:hypothetical protein
MQNVYRKGDPSSSPFDPAMGDIVIYRDRRRGLAAAETYPAIIVKSYPNDRCDLTVFTSFGTRHIMNVGFNSSMDGENVWFWPQPKTERKTVEVAPVTDEADIKSTATVSGSGSAKPVDKPSKVAQTAKV